MSKRSESNKFQKHAAHLRTDLELSIKSKKISERDKHQIESEIAHILVSRNLNYPPTLLKYGLSTETTYDERKAILDLITKRKTPTLQEQRFIAFMQQSQQVSNQTNWRFRIAEEADQKHKEGWYPFFVTITVDPKIVDSKAMWQSGKEWQSLVKRLSKIASNQMGHTPFWKKPYRKITEYMTYVAVIEHGKSREHHHLHALIWLKDIPSKWKLCPNRNFTGQNKTHNRCRELETYWKLGRTEVNYFRSVGDIYEIKHNFSLPIKNGQPMKVAPPQAAGNYLTKYLQKDHKQWNHRMKATRNLGLTRLKKLLHLLTSDMLEPLTWRPMTYRSSLSLSQTHSVPLGLIRQLAKQQHFYNQYHNKTQTLKTLMSIPLKPYIKMLQSVRSGVRPERMGIQDFYDWLSQLLPDQNEYCDSRLTDSHEIVGKYFPRLYKNVKPVKFGANTI